MKLPLPKRPDYMKHFSKDGPIVRLTALAIVFSPSIVIAAYAAHSLFIK